MLKGAIKLERDKGMIVLDEHMNLNDPDVKKISTNVVAHIKYTSLFNLH